MSVTVESIGVPPVPIAALLVIGNALDEGWMDQSRFELANGESEITLPTTLGIRIAGGRDSLSGRIDVCVTALAAGAGSLASACETQEAVPGEIVEILVVLDFGSSDAGTDAASDAGPDAGSDAGLDSGSDAGSLCGDGVRDGLEECDGADLGGEDCVSVGFSGGMLVCDGACMFDVTTCAGPPTVPVPRLPMNNAYVGSVHVPGSLAPTFVWEPSIVGGGASIDYELEYGADPGFSAPATTTVMTMFPNHQPSADLPVSVAVPVGARYYWRVRACAGATCSAYSPVWWVNVGRNDQDVNGDGYADVLVGAWGNDTGGADAGRAYVHLGGPAGVGATADTTLTGDVAGDFFGTSVALAGDVNGDGYTDVIVGANGNDAGGANAGRAYVYLGGPAGIGTTADSTLTGEAAGDAFGRSVAPAGDVNGDGYADVIVGAFWNDAGGSNAGRAYVYLGGPAGVSTTPDVTFTGEAAQDFFGTSVASAGDVNGDGYADVIVGASRNDAGGGDAGSAYVHLGGPGGLGMAPDITLAGEAASDYFGASVAPAGDANGDGYADVIVGASGNDVGGADAGRAYIYFGGPGGVGTMADTTLGGEVAGDFFGTSVALAGDVDGDGYTDVIVGAPENDVGGVNAGRAYVYLGGPAGIGTTADSTLTGEVGGDSFGTSVALAGDIDGDGYADVIVGAYNFGGTNIGRAYVHVGGPAGVVSTPDTALTGEVAGDRFGISVAHVTSPNQCHEWLWMPQRCEESCVLACSGATATKS